MTFPVTKDRLLAHLNSACIRNSLDRIFKICSVLRELRNVQAEFLHLRLPRLQNVSGPILDRLSCLGCRCAG